MIAETLFIALCIFAVAFMFAPIGMGGGMLFVPLIHYGLGWEINGALFAVSLTLTAVVSWGSGLAHRKEDYFDNSALKMGLRGAVPGALVGVGIVTLIDDKMDFVFVRWRQNRKRRMIRNSQLNHNPLLCKLEQESEECFRVYSLSALV